MITVAHDHLGRRVHIDDTASSMDYFCPVCGSPLDTKRGSVRRHHFAHKASHGCTDTWHGTYSDSEWHFSWEERYPKENRERTLALDQISHRADVLTGRTVVEFQHSTLSPQDFSDRNAFYEDLGYKVVWLYDLRDLYASGAIVEVDHESLTFAWDNPRQSFNAYDLVTGMADLFFQLRDEGERKCIVRVRSRGEDGFERFEARNWLSADEFLHYTGLTSGECPPPDMAPLEPNEDYLRFKERYSIQLNKQQERAVQTVDGSTLLLAVPGSGKTTAMVARIGYLIFERGVPPESIIAVTYNKAAVREMRERFASRFQDAEVAQRVAFRTINSLCDKICREGYRSLGQRKPEIIKDKEKARLFRGLYKRASGDFLPERERIEMENAISYIKNNKVSDEEVDARFVPNIDHFGDVFYGYRAYLAEHHLMDFDDQMVHAQELFKSNPQLYRHWRERYRFWCVDEAQDTSLLQHQLIYNLAGPNGCGNIFMVGDEDQSIYGFRGARPTAMLNFKFNYPNPFVLKLERNYRSGEEIVKAASAFVGKCTGRFEKRMTSARGAGSVVRAEEVCGRLDQYDAVRRIIADHDGGGSLGIIYRDNEAGIPLIDQLLREGTGFELLAKANTFFTSSVVLDIRAFMELSLDPRNESAFKRIWVKANCYISANDAKYAPIAARKRGITIPEALVEQMTEYRKGAKRKRQARSNAQRFKSIFDDVAMLPPLAAIDRIVEGGYGAWMDENNVPMRRTELLRHIAASEKTVASFLRRLDQLDSICKGEAAHPTSRQLSLMTAHASKGREFDTVVILDAVNGAFPSSQMNPWNRSKDVDENYQEERRLFYVAMTRARNELILTRPATEETPFVDEVVPRSKPERKPDTATTPSPFTPTGRATGHSAQTDHARQGAPSLPRWRNAVPKTTPLRYDILTWQEKENYNPNQRIVSNGDMDAMLTVDSGKAYADMTIDLNQKILSDVAGHLDELRGDLEDLTICVDVHEAQLTGSVVTQVGAEETYSLYFSGKDSEGILRCLAAILNDDIPLSVTYQGGAGNAVGRTVASVHEDSNTVSLSREQLEVY